MSKRPLSIRLVTSISNMNIYVHIEEWIASIVNNLAGNGNYVFMNKPEYYKTNVQSYIDSMFNALEADTLNQADIASFFGSRGRSPFLLFEPNKNYASSFNYDELVLKDASSSNPNVPTNINGQVYKTNTDGDIALTKTENNSGAVSVLKLCVETLHNSYDDAPDMSAYIRYKIAEMSERGYERLFHIWLYSIYYHFKYPESSSKFCAFGTRFDISDIKIKQTYEVNDNILAQIVLFNTTDIDDISIIPN